MKEERKTDRKKILIVEDELIVAEDLKEALEELGHEVIGMAARSDKALSLAAEHQPDLACMDIVIKGDRDGIETAIQLQKELGIPSVFTSAYSDSKILDRAKKAQPVGYLVKPYDITVLRCTLQIAFAKIEADKKLQEQTLWLESEVERRTEKLRDMERQLIQAQKMEAVGTLTGGIAHDFNNMLLPILGYSTMLRESLTDRPELAEQANEIHKAADSASSLTKQLLAFSRRQILSKGVINVHEVINRSQKMITRMIGEGTSLEMDLAEEPLHSLVDKGQIEQVIMNLCINARDAMGPGGKITVKTQIATRDTEVFQNKRGSDILDREWLQLSVSDTGCGMSQEMISHVFDPFYSTKGNEGTGLGLSVVHGIVTQHDGQIYIHSKLGQGTEFRVFLPLEKPVEETHKELRISEPKGGTETILVIEDEPHVSLFVTRALMNKGYKVTTANNIKGAKLRLEEANEPFDLIFSDCVLPDGSGVDLLTDYLSENPSMPCILSTGYTDREALTEAAEKHGILFLQKPYALAELFQTVRQALRIPLARAV